MLSPLKHVLNFKIDRYLNFFQILNVWPKYSILLFVQNLKPIDEFKLNEIISSKGSWFRFCNEWAPIFFSKNLHSYIKNYNIIISLNSMEDIFFVKNKLILENNYIILGCYFKENNSFIFIEDLKLENIKKKKIYYTFEAFYKYWTFINMQNWLAIKSSLKKKKDGNN